MSICVGRLLEEGPPSLYRIKFQSELPLLLSIQDLLAPLLCCALQMSNPLSVLLIREEVTKEEKASNLFAMDSATSTHAVPSRDVTGIISWLSFVPLVVNRFSMTKEANKFAVNCRSSLLQLED